MTVILNMAILVVLFILLLMARSVLSQVAIFSLMVFVASMILSDG